MKGTGHISSSSARSESTRVGPQLPRTSTFQRALQFHRGARGKHSSSSGAQLPAGQHKPLAASEQKTQLRFSHRKTSPSRNNRRISSSTTRLNVHGLETPNNQPTQSTWPSTIEAAPLPTAATHSGSATPSKGPSD